MSRAAEIAKVLSKYGLDFLAHSQSPLSILGFPAKLFPRKHAHSQPERVRMAIEELGTTYIKLGQAISTRTDLIPNEYVAELAKLQDAAPEIPYTDVRAVIIHELGCPPEQIFCDFEREPLAAASIGQVHRARLEDGTRVVVKVQRPGAQEQVEKDLKVMADFVKMIGGTAQLRDYDLDGWLQEFGFTLRNELDYRREGRNADRFRCNFAEDPTLHIPRVYWEYTSLRVLTMEEVGGVKITDVSGLDRMCIDRRRLAEECSRIILTEIFEYGFFHADPHAGNFFVNECGQINLVDFGMVGTIDRAERETLMRITIAMSRRDSETLLDELLTIGTARRPVNRQDLKIELDRLLELHLDGPPEEFSLAETLQDTLKLAATHKIRLPSDIVFLARALAMAEGLGHVLDPSYRMIDQTRAQLKDIYRETRSPASLAERAQENYMDFGELAIDFPKRVRRLFGQLERGDITFTAKMDMSEFIENIHRATNRLSVSVLMAGVIAGLSVLTLSLSDRVARLWVNVFLAFVIGGGLILLAGFLRSRKAE
ncbi:MAG TPA: AarF/ABC1/UbiB kinase family protein [Fimbriimonas sp.]|nr:AarF/ABC1/UbiB kinase family protein [Fimbriimonas sp.]